MANDPGVSITDHNANQPCQQKVPCHPWISAIEHEPVLIAYTVKDCTAERDAIWVRIGVAFPHDKGAGLTILLEALPMDGRIVLIEPKAELPPLPA